MPKRLYIMTLQRTFKLKINYMKMIMIMMITCTIN